MYSNLTFADNLNQLLEQLGISGAQLAKALAVDPALVSRWRKTGCGTRSASQHAYAIGRYVASLTLSAENRAWLSAALQAAGLGEYPVSQGVALWLNPYASMPESPEQPTEFVSQMVLDSFHGAVSPDAASARPRYDIRAGRGEIAAEIDGALGQARRDSVISVYLSSETAAIAVDPAVVGSIRKRTEERGLKVRMLVQSANNSQMLSRLVSAYMPVLVGGRLTLNLVQGTPQTFTSTMNLILSQTLAVVVTEVVRKSAAAVATFIRDEALIRDMEENFEESMRYARPLMNAYDDSYARNIIEAFFEEYGMPGSLDVIKSGLNPLYMTLERYGKVLQKFGHSGEQLEWRYNEFIRFHDAMAEVLSLTKLREIGRTGRCRMPSMYFAEVGVWYLDAEDCVDLLDGYTKKSGAVRENRSKFVDDIDEIISVKDVVPAFEPDVRLPDPSDVIEVRIREKQKKTGLYLSDSNYLNLYDFALALNGRYAGAKTEDEMKRAFEENLSLEYKLSNIAQAKGFAAQLETIGCFYTDRAVDYPPVTDFQALIRIPGHEDDLTKIAIAEHERWCAEKRAMGWDYGVEHVGKGEPDANGRRKNDNVMRDRLRRHHDLVDYGALEATERFKDVDPMEQMAELIKAYDGLTIYRMR